MEQQKVEAKVYGIAVEGGKNVVLLIINGSIDTNILGFARLAKAGVPVVSVNA